MRLPRTPIHKITTGDIGTLTRRALDILAEHTDLPPVARLDVRADTRQVQAVPGAHYEIATARAVAIWAHRLQIPLTFSSAETPATLSAAGEITGDDEDSFELLFTMYLYGGTARLLTWLCRDYQLDPGEPDDGDHSCPHCGVSMAEGQAEGDYHADPATLIAALDAGLAAYDRLGEDAKKWCSTDTALTQGTRAAYLAALFYPVGLDHDADRVLEQHP